MKTLTSMEEQTVQVLTLAVVPPDTAKLFLGDFFSHICETKKGKEREYRFKKKKECMHFKYFMDPGQVAFFAFAGLSFCPYAVFFCFPQ